MPLFSRRRLRYCWIFAGNAPQSSVVVPDISYQLKEHIVRCEVCTGQGYVSPKDEELCRSCEEITHCQKRCVLCDVCEGEGKFHWSRWYPSGIEVCLYCHERVPVDFRVVEEMVWAPICFPCYLALHKELCGCDLWVPVEQQILGLLVFYHDKNY